MKARITRVPPDKERELLHMQVSVGRSMHGPTVAEALRSRKATLEMVLVDQVSGTALAIARTKSGHTIEHQGIDERDAVGRLATLAVRP